VKNVVQYILTDGQSSAEALFYAKFPSALAAQGKKLLAGVSANGQPNQRASSSAGK